MGHIPASETFDIDILPFETALNTDDGSYDKNSWFFVPGFYCEYRYILATRGHKPMICIGINPSTAKPGELDMTLKSVERVSAYNGYDCFTMFNVYAQRSTKVPLLDKRCNPILHEENMKAFEYVLKISGEAPSIWAAWGTSIDKRPYFADCLRTMAEIGIKYNAHWYTAGKISKDGHPQHPLYLRHDSKMFDFDIKDYLENKLRHKTIRAITRHGSLYGIR